MERNELKMVLKWLAPLAVMAYALVIPLLSRAGQDQQRSTVVGMAGSTAAVEQTNHALLIYVQKYQDVTLNLQYPKSDVTKLERVLLDNYDFNKENVRVLADPDRDGILSALDHYEKTLGKNDSLLIFFAGHGRWDPNRDQGYWFPKNASRESRSTWISNADLRDSIKAIKSRHTLLISDACFSGSLLLRDSNLSMAPSVAINELMSKASRRAITSGALTTVPDQSVFVDYLVRRLNDNQDPHLAVGRLFASLREPVTNNSKTKQVPQYGAIHEAGDEGGEYVFVRRVRQTVFAANGNPPTFVGKPASLPAPAPEAMELEYWQSIKGSNNIKDFEAYLRHYPRGRFVDLVQNRLEGLKPASNIQPTTAIAPSGLERENSSISSRRLPDFTSVNTLILHKPSIQKTQNQVDQYKQPSSIDPNIIPLPPPLKRLSILLNNNLLTSPVYRTTPDLVFDEDSQPVMTNEAESVRSSLYTVSQYTTGALRNGSFEKIQGVCEVFREDLGKGAVLEMVRIAGGKFIMGSPKSETGRSRYEGPQREVNVTEFLMGQHEVTQRIWRAVARLPKVKVDLNLNPSLFKGDELPVENVSWEEVKEFIARLNRKLGLAAETGYRLPSEAEWEFAARAGATTPFSFGEILDSNIVNYDGNYPYNNREKGQYRSRTIAVGSLGVANGWGLYDMHGNVWEWCDDNWHDNYSGAPVDSRPWNDGQTAVRVIHGGSWGSGADKCRSASRNWSMQFDRNFDVGFRLSRTLPSAPLPTDTH